MLHVETISELRAARGNLTGRIGLVPTMGALHAGHISLVEYARAETDAVIATVFVNPTQFAPDEDLDAYPRDLPRDLKMFQNAGVDLVFTPSPSQVYPSDFQTYVTVEAITQGLEGNHRPGHFRGVTTVVAKLFNLTQPDIAYFGQKDAQQAAVIRRMVYDLNFPLQVAVCPTIREADGLAMSSRNVYLSAEERSAATILYRALCAAGEAYTRGERSPQKLRQIVSATLASESLAQVEYITINDAQTLKPVDQRQDSPLLLSLAAKVGPARLIDNIMLPLTLNTREGLQKVLGASHAKSS
jgi:pantoate--beta-alanine ligase